MTYRERREAKADKLREWAGNREAKAIATLNSQPELRGDWAFITQPGHIPERARMNAADDRACQSLEKAGAMKGRAAGIERQLDGAIYSDDDGAAEACERKAGELEASADCCKRVNAAWRKAGKPRPGNAEGWVKVGEILGSGDGLDKIRLSMARDFLEREPYPSYHGANLRANARRYRERAKAIREQEGRQAACEAAGGFLITRHPEANWCAVRFEAKPERAILEALRAAGYGWGGGQWSGYLDKLPAAVAELEAGR